VTSALDTLLGPADDMVNWPAQLGDHLSASRLSSFYRCPEAFRRKYLLGEWEAKSVALHWGSAHHRAIERNYEQKISSHEDLPADEVEDAFRDAFVTDDLDSLRWDEGEKPAETLDAGIALIRLYHERVAPRVQPLAVEEPFSFRVPGLPVDVIGRIDVRAIVDGQRRTIEEKTSNRAVATPKDDWRFQGRVYRRAHPVPVQWHVSVKHPTSPAVYTPAEKPGLLFEPTDALAAATDALILNRARLMVAMFNAFGPDQPWPDAVEHQFACNYCQFGPTRGDSSCAYWGAS
jgi:hypothetical protein